MPPSPPISVRSTCGDGDVGDNVPGSSVGAIIGPYIDGANGRHAIPDKGSGDSSSDDDDAEPSSSEDVSSDFENAESSNDSCDNSERLCDYSS